MAPWYEEAEFYHIYPIGLTGAPRKNESEETVHRFSTLEQWLPHIADLGCTAIYIGPLFESTTHGYATFRKKENSPRTADGTKESGSAETPAITTDSPTKHGETASNSST